MADNNDAHHRVTVMVAMRAGSSLCTSAARTLAHLCHARLEGDVSHSDAQAAMITLIAKAKPHEGEMGLQLIGVAETMLAEANSVKSAKAA